MRMGGMVPVDAARADRSQVSGGCYALYPGRVLLVAAGLVLALIVHRLMHGFH
jgi:hypothetical protein